MALQVEQLITDHLDLWTQAQTAKSTSGRGSNNKIELTGIKKLRELILELAVRGKLVPQDPNDEPASELLKRIAAEKEALVKAGKLKKQKPLPAITDEEKPFELSVGWQWARLGYAATYGSSDKAEAKDADENTWVLELEDIEKETSRLIQKVRFSEREFKSTKSQFNTGDVLYGKLRPYLDKVIVADEPGVCTTEIIPIKCYGKFSPYYLRWMLKTPRFIKYADESTHGMNMPRLGTDKGEMALVAVAPVREQTRIVAKVDELMVLCDQLEQQSYQQIDAHNQLVDALLTTLTQSQNADELASNWQRLAAHFDTLFITEYSINALKQTVLQLAVMGKLVKQDPNDEPASELLKRIAFEKDALVKAGKIKKQKPLPPISEDEKPFELPEGWALERIGTFALVGTGATPARDNPAYWSPKEVSWVSSGETSQPVICETKEKVSLLAVKETNVSIYPVGTLIVAMYGQGKTRGQITELKIEAGTNQACAAIELVEKSEWHKDFIKLFFQKSYSELRELAAGGAQPNLNVGKIADTVVPIPPLNEQKMIVIKVTDLMKMCGLLLEALESKNLKLAVLAEALVEQVVA